jgi:hypothetical protein
LEVLFWNINNNKNAVKLISETDFIGIDRVFGFAEYWDVDSHITSLFSNKNLWIDDVKKLIVTLPTLRSTTMVLSSISGLFT